MTHSNNGDSCFSLFEKIHFVLLSAPSSSARPARNSSHCLLLPRLIRESERTQGERRESGGDEREKKRDLVPVNFLQRNMTAVQLIPELYQLQSGSTQR